LSWTVGIIDYYVGAALRISRKSDYALRAMIELARSHGDRPLQTGEIAARRSIPESFLEQLLPALRKAGIVASLRGPRGGHSLAIPPSELTAGDVMRAMEGMLLEVECNSSGAPCALVDGCAVHDMWQELRAAMEQVLDRTTIEDLAAREAEKRGSAMYYI